MSWMEVITPLQQALTKEPQDFQEVRALISEALKAARETATMEVDSIQLGVDVGETISLAKAILEERERCARIAESHTVPPPRAGADSAILAAAQDLYKAFAVLWPREIAHAIRQGKEGRP